MQRFYSKTQIVLTNKVIDTRVEKFNGTGQRHTRLSDFQF